MTKSTTGRPGARGQQSLDKRLEVEVEGVGDTHYHFHGEGMAGEGRRVSKTARRSFDRSVSANVDDEPSYIAKLPDQSPAKGFPLWPVVVAAGFIVPPIVASVTGGNETPFAIVLRWAGIAVMIAGALMGLSKATAKR